MASQQTSIVHFLPPSDDRAAAMQAASKYLNQTGTLVASFMLEFPPLNDDTAMLAEFSNCVLRGAALCEGLLDLDDEQQRL